MEKERGETGGVWSAFHKLADIPITRRSSIFSGNNFADHTVAYSLNSVQRSGTLDTHGMFDLIYGLYCRKVKMDIYTE